jgi:electron transfer flavoprotein beta subunit
VKICVLVKEVPEAAGGWRIEPQSGRLDRSGGKALNRYDAHALEAAVQLRGGGELDVQEIVAVSMGPESARRTLERAISLGADRGILLSDPALAGSDAAGTGYALARVLSVEAPDLVLMGQQSEDGGSYVVPSIVGEHLRLPVVTQVGKIAVAEGRLHLERATEHGYDTLRVRLPAVVSVTYTINEPRYPSLKAKMAARQAPLTTVTAADLALDAQLIGGAGARVACVEHHAPAERTAGAQLEGSDADAAAAAIIAWLEARRVI